MVRLNDAIVFGIILSILVVALTMTASFYVADYYWQGQARARGAACWKVTEEGKPYFAWNSSDFNTYNLEPDNMAPTDPNRVGPVEATVGSIEIPEEDFLLSATIQALWYWRKDPNTKLCLWSHKDKEWGTLQRVELPQWYMPQVFYSTDPNSYVGSSSKPRTIP